MVLAQQHLNNKKNFFFYLLLIIEEHQKLHIKLPLNKKITT